MRDKKNEMKRIYGRYFTNWKKSEYILKTFDSYFKRMEHHLGLELEMRVEDHRIKPIQMVNRYHLFFGDLLTISGRLYESKTYILYVQCLAICKEISQNVNDVISETFQ